MIIILVMSRLLTIISQYNDNNDYYYHHYHYHYYYYHYRIVNSFTHISIATGVSKVSTRPRI